MIKKSKKIVVAMSGGVDSSVSAALLKRAGFHVTGIFMKCWGAERPNYPAQRGGSVANIADIGECTAEEDEQWARMAASQINIPFYSVDLVKEYKNRVVDYFVNGYRAGVTPNPDVMCNKEIKFGMFYDLAINEFGGDYVATGHYARIHRSDLCNCNYTGLTCVSCVRLLKGKDPNKDQSYFLWAVEREKFKNVLFPVGDYKKIKVRKLAREFGLPNSDRPDSQGICFIGKVNVGNFLTQYIDQKPGVIVNSQGVEVGRHAGLHFYTIGQRRGIKIGGGLPYYVAQKNFADNTLIVAREYDESLMRKSLTASNINWISAKPSFPFKCAAKIRYRQVDQDAIIKHEDNNGVFVEFKNPQRAVTSGQSIVFYKEDELIGGGIIK